MFLTIIFFVILSIYIFNRLTCGYCKSNTCLIGKTVIITGGVSGIGYQAALGIASRGAKLIIADVEPTQETVANVIKITGNSNVTGKHLNLASFQSVRAFAKEINETEERLDVLVNNAGIFSAKQDITEDGVTPIMQINHYGPFLLTHLLIPLLKKSAPSRIIFTSSVAAFTYTQDVTDENLLVTREVDNNSFRSVYTAYSNSKLCVVVASDMFAKKLDGTGVTSNSLHPGCINSELIQKNSHLSLLRDVQGFLLKLFVLKINGKSTYEGAQTILHLALEKSLENVTGKYFIDCIPFFKPSPTKSNEFCKKVWEVSEKCVKLTPDEKI